MYGRFWRNERRPDDEPQGIMDERLVLSAAETLSLDLGPVDQTLGEAGQRLRSFQRLVVNRSKNMGILEVATRLKFDRHAVEVAPPREWVVPVLAIAHASLLEAQNQGPGGTVPNYLPPYEYSAEIAPPDNLPMPYLSFHTHQQAAQQEVQRLTAAEVEGTCNIFTRLPMPNNFTSLLRSLLREDEQGQSIVHVVPPGHHYLGLTRHGAWSGINTLIRFKYTCNRDLHFNGPQADHAQWMYDDTIRSSDLLERLTRIRWGTADDVVNLIDDLETHILHPPAQAPDAAFQRASAAEPKNLSSDDDPPAGVPNNWYQRGMNELKAEKQLHMADNELANTDSHVGSYAWLALCDAKDNAQRSYEAAKRGCSDRLRDPAGTLDLLELPDDLLYAICEWTFGSDHNEEIMRKASTPRCKAEVWRRG